MRGSGAVVASLALLSSLLAGCAFLGDDDAGSAGDLTRLIVFTLDEDAFEALEDADGPEEALAALGDATWTYTHDADDVAVEGLTVHFAGVSGRVREHDLSDYTDLDTLSRGDRVEVNGVLPSSPFSVRDGDQVLAARGTSQRDWLTAAGAPLPFEVSGDAEARWRLSAEGEASAVLDLLRVVEHVTEEDYSCYWDEDVANDASCPQEVSYNSTFEVSDLDFAASGEGELEFGLAAEASAGELDLVASLSGDLSLESSFFMHTLEAQDGPNAYSDVEDMGYDVSFTADGQSEVTLIFNDGELEEVEAEGEAQADGDITLRDADHPDGYTPEWVEHPLFDESFGPISEDVPGFGAPSEVRDFLEALWAMDLAAGDEFRFLGDSGDLDGGQVRLESVVRVTGEDERTVEAGTFDVLRVTASLAIHVTSDGESFDFELPGATVWIERGTGLPVEADVDLSLSFDEDTILGLIDAAAQASGDDVEITRPQQAQAQGSMSMHLELVEHDAGLRVAPMAVLFGGPGFVLAAPLAVVGGITPFYYGGFDDDYGEPMESDIPAAAFQASGQSGAVVLSLIMSDGPIEEWHVVVWLDGFPCYQVLPDGPFADDGQWTVGESMRLETDCSSGEPLAAGEHDVRLDYDSTVLFEGTVNV